MTILITACAALASAAEWIPRGTTISVTTSETMQAQPNQAGGRIFPAVLISDVVDKDGHLMAQKGSAAELIVRQVGKDQAIVDLESITVDGHRYAVSAAQSEGEGVQRDDIKKKEGAFTGGGATVAHLVNEVPGARGKSVDVPANTVLTFSLEQLLRVDIADSGFDRDGHHYHGR